jgi:hypothetical protein
MRGHTDGDRLGWLETRLGWDVAFLVWWRMPYDSDFGENQAREMTLRQLIDAAMAAEAK